jgi:CRP-like cAMP-binding protein
MSVWSASVGQTFEQFLEAYPSKVFEKGQLILLKDEVPQGVYIIESGFIKTYSIGPNGEERIITIDAAGEDIPIGYTAGLITRSQYFYEAYSECTVRIVPISAYSKHLSENITSLLRRHVRITRILLSTLSRVEALEQPKASDKVAHMLLNMAERMGAAKANKSRLKLTVTQQEIADSSGLTRETAGQVLKKLELRKLVQHSRQSYTLSMERLKKYLERNR